MKTKINLLIGFGLICIFFKITGFNLLYIFYALLGLLPITFYCYLLNRDIMTSDDAQKRIDKAQIKIKKAKESAKAETKRLKEEELSRRRAALGKLDARKARNQFRGGE